MANRRLRLLTGLVAGIAVALASIAVAATPTTPTTYVDAVGDAGGAPDIVSVSVTTDAVTGSVELSVTTAGIAAIDPRTKFDVNVFVDADRKPGSGSLSGCEYWLRATDHDWTLYRWSAADWWQTTAPPPTMAFRRDGGTLSWRFQAADIGATTGFSFSTSAAVYDVSGYVVGLDFAPDHGDWTCDLTARRIAPVIGKLDAGGPAVAGKRLALRAAVENADTGLPLTDATIECESTVAGRPLAHAVSFYGGLARVSLVVPRHAKGKQLRVKITVSATGGSADRVATFRIR